MNESRGEAAAARDAVAALAHTDSAAAEAGARAIGTPFYRAQALAWVARYAADVDHVIRLGQAALAAAADCDDAYQQVVSSAWAIRAMFERDRRYVALEMLELVLHAVPRVMPNSSRAEALSMLLQAAFAADRDVRRGLLFALAELHDRDPHWRVRRAYHTALGLLRTVDAEFAAKMMPDATAGAPGVGGGDAEVHEPRPFFW